MQGERGRKKWKDRDLVEGNALWRVGETVEGEEVVGDGGGREKWRVCGEVWKVKERAVRKEIGWVSGGKGGYKERDSERRGGGGGEEEGDAVRGERSVGCVEGDMEGGR